MTERIRQTQGGEGDAGPKWFNSAVTRHRGTLSEVRKHIPAFERRAFGLTQSDTKLTRRNGHLDTIVRMPFGADNTFVPIGVVSKSYILVPHTDVVDVVRRALNTAKIDTERLLAEIEITEYGERMALSLCLPEEYGFKPDDGHAMALRLECFNSVDGSTRFRALMGWFRFVCRNGLIIGVTRSDLHRRHVGDLRLEDVDGVLSDGLGEAETDQRNFGRWLKTGISRDALATWGKRCLA